MVMYPNLEAEMIRRDVSHDSIAQSINVKSRTVRNKLSGKTPFTWPEVKTIRKNFFSDIPVEVLFATAAERSSA